MTDPFMGEFDTDAYFAAMKQHKRVILKNIKSLYMMESNTLANFAAMKQLKTGILKDTKSLFMMGFSIYKQKC